MANRTIAQKIAVLEARRDALESALTATTTGSASVSLDGMSVAHSSPAAIRAELTATEKSLQRLYRGGRGMQVDLSYPAGSAEGDTSPTEYVRQTI